MSLVQNLDGDFDPVRLSVLSQLHPLTVEDLGKRSSTQTFALKQIYYAIKNMGELFLVWTALWTAGSWFGSQIFTTDNLVWGKKNK